MRAPPVLGDVLTVEASATDFERLSAEIAVSVRLGYEALFDNPGGALDALHDGEIEWLAGWLVSDG